ncbi:MAG: lipopolysaccharide heptosyltransferase II [Chloroflexota bacterium]
MRNAKDALVTVLGRFLSGVFARFGGLPPVPDDPRSILLIKPCCIGDVLMATATIAATKAAFPNATLTVAVGSWSREVLAHNPHVDRLMDAGLVGSGQGTQWRAYIKLLRELRRQRFDLALVLDRSPQFTVIPWLVGIPVRAGIDSSGRGFALQYKAPWPPEQHEVELYLSVLCAIGVQPCQGRMEFCPTSEELEWAKAMLQSKVVLAEKEATPWAGVRVVVHPGGGANPGRLSPVKRWFPDRYAVIIQRLLERGAQVVLVGSSADRALNEGIVKQVPPFLEGKTGIMVDLTGATTLGQLGAVIQCCDLFIGNDAGPLHLAVAVGTPSVAVFGPSDPRRYRPYLERSITIHKGVPCSPCFVRGGLPFPCTQPWCMEAVTVEDVWQAVVTLLAGHPEKESRIEKG